MRTVGHPSHGARPETDTALVVALTASMRCRLSTVDIPDEDELTILSWVLAGDLAARPSAAATGTAMELQPRALEVLMHERDCLNRPDRDLRAVALAVADLKVTHVRQTPSPDREGLPTRHH